MKKLETSSASSDTLVINPPVCLLVKKLMDSLPMDSNT